MPAGTLSGGWIVNPLSARIMSPGSSSESLLQLCSTIEPRKLLELVFELFVYVYAIKCSNQISNIIFHLIIMIYEDVILDCGLNCHWVLLELLSLTKYFTLHIHKLYTNTFFEGGS